MFEPFLTPWPLNMEHVALYARLFCHRSVDYYPFTQTESRRTKVRTVVQSINKLSGIPNAGGNGNAESSRGQALAMEGTREEELNSLIV